MSTTTDLNTLKINYLTQAQYDAAVNGGTINENEIYMTPKDDISEFQARVSTLENDMDVLGTRMDSFTNLEDGSTTGDAELIDGRIGADSVTYNNIGTAIRTQVSNLMDATNVLSENISDSSKLLSPYLVNTTKSDSVTYSLSGNTLSCAGTASGESYFTWWGARTGMPKNMMPLGKWYVAKVIMTGSGCNVRITISTSSQPTHYELLYCGKSGNYLFKVPEDTTAFRIISIYNNQTVNGTVTLEISRAMGCGYSDGTSPKYVAFGGSTTIGAVHHIDGGAITYSKNAYPEYIGMVSGFETVNLGQGGTGFMSRSAGNTPNIMDCIYANSSTLNDAALITLHFGYGNDYTAGLPVGEWDDYYPYDTDGYFFVQGNTSGNLAGITSMLSHGATLLGCLNWCIKWIGDNYPNAVLVCICGAPSANADRNISISANSASGAGTSGVAPYKVSITEDNSAFQTQVATLMKKMNTPFVNLYKDGLPFSYYSTYATLPDGTYSVFSTTGTSSSPTWNGHPNDNGYLIYARYIASKVLDYFKH